MPLARIAPELQHAVIAAEDGRFYQHHGIDWKEVQKVVDQDLDDGRIGRGGSTITQQLVKNLFFTTSRSFLRKGIEFTLAPVAELILPKQRILELYLNVIEWGPGVYGAEAACAELVRRAGRQGGPRPGRASGGRDSRPAAPQTGPHELLQRRNPTPHVADVVSASNALPGTGRCLGAGEPMIDFYARPQAPWALRLVPPFPAVAQRVLALVNNEDAGVRQVGELIKMDPSFSAELLRFANSALFGSRREVRDLRHAISMVGLDRRQIMATFVAVNRMVRSAVRTAGAT